MLDTGSGRTGVFLSYRREQASGQAGRLYDILVARFGEHQVFRDVDSIRPGVDFDEAIRQAVGACRVVLVFIGPGWLEMANEDGLRRLDQSDDYVRIEIEAALERNIRLIPVLVNDAKMPAAKELAPELGPMARRQSMPLRDISFRSDAAGLIEELTPALEGAHASFYASVAERGGPRRGTSESFAQRWGDGVFVTQIFETDDTVFDLAVHPLGYTVAVASPDKGAVLFSSAGGRAIGTFLGLRGAWSVTFSPNGKQIAVAAATPEFNLLNQGNLNIYDVSTKKLLTKLPLVGSAFPVRFSTDGKSLATADGNTVRMWNVEQRRDYALLNHTAKVRQLVLRADTKALIAITQNDVVHVWDIGSQRETAQLPLTGGNCVSSSAAFLSDGRAVVADPAHELVHIRDISTNQELAVFGDRDDATDPEPYSAEVQITAFNSASDALVATDLERVSLWDLQTATLITRQEAWGVRRVAFDADDSTMVTAAIKMENHPRLAQRRSTRSPMTLSSWRPAHVTT